MAGLATISKIQGAKGTRYRAMVQRKGFPMESAYFERKTDAQKWAQTIEAQITQGKHPVGSEAQRHTVSELISRYELEVLPHKKSAKDQRQQLSVWEILVGHLKLSELTPNALLQARIEILKRPGRGTPQISQASVNRYTGRGGNPLGPRPDRRAGVQRTPCGVGRMGAGSVGNFRDGGIGGT